VSVLFTVAQAGVGPPRQNIQSISINADGSVTLTYATTPGFAYHVEARTNLVIGSWTTLAGSVTNANGTVVNFTDSNPIGSAQRFYRTVSP